jgi:hypothetical protein
MVNAHKKDEKEEALHVYRFRSSCTDRHQGPIVDPFSFASNLARGVRLDARFLWILGVFVTAIPRTAPGTSKSGACNVQPTALSSRSKNPNTRYLRSPKLSI